MKDQRVVAREERILGNPNPILVFQPEVLPQIAAMHFIGNQELSQDDLRQIMRKGLDGAGFTERTFSTFLDGSALPAGAPFDYEYVHDFLRDLSKQIRLPAGDISIDYGANSTTHVVDQIVHFH